MGMEKLITGAAIGAFIVFITKDEEARKATERFIDGTGKILKSILRRLTPTHSSRIIEGVAQAVNQPGQAAKDTVRKESGDAEF